MILSNKSTEKSNLTHPHYRNQPLPSRGQAGGGRPRGCGPSRPGGPPPTQYAGGSEASKGEPMLPLRVWTLQKVPQRSESASTQLKMTVHSSTSAPARVLTEQAFDVARETPPPLWSGLKCEFSKRGRNRAKTALCTARL